jgi:DNA repair protein RecN (Recombination protein N)
MLSYLRIRGLALLDDVSLDFSSGMIVLTGETGAGKSIIVDALSLLRGSRGKAELVREGAQGAIVDAQFEPGPATASAVRELLAAHGLPEEEPETVVVQRLVPRSGRGRCVVQATVTTQTALGRIGEELLDICSQHEHHFLTHTARHLEVLDAYAGLEDEVAAYHERYRLWREARTSLADLRSRTAERAQRADFLRFQIEELDRVGPEPGEHDALRRRLSLLRDARRWAELARDVHGTLYEEDDAIAARLAGLAERARGGEEGSQLLAQIREQLTAAQIACEEAAQMAARFGDELEVDPRELEAAEDRLHELESLRRKHGLEVDELAERATAMRNELAELDHADDHLAALESRVHELEQACMRAADELHERRSLAAQGLGHAVERELAALHIPAARLEVRLEAVELGPHGVDRVEFLFTANPGEPLSPLRKVASGGELSRVLLALKGVLAAQDRVSTYVFDEVDAGVGGAVAEAIGRRLRQAAVDHQVLCITHLPQIAAFADAHYRVEKLSRKGRTITRVVRLSDDDRVEELARMLGGAKVTRSAREHAAQLIAEARRPPQKSSKPARGRRRASARA